jgi:hypothetical protein
MEWGKFGKKNEFGSKDYGVGSINKTGKRIKEQEVWKKPVRHR